MPSPDFSKYVDLTIYDAQPVDIYDDAVEYARIALPEWTPVTGSVEDAILQAGAQMTGELVGAINRLPDGVVEALLQLFGITRDTGVAPSATATIHVINAGGYTVPAGTRFGYLDSSDPLNPVLYTFDTDEELTIATGSTSGQVSITGTVATEYPTLAANDQLQLLSAYSFINYASLDEDLNVGADPETDSEYLTRAIAKLNSYTTALVLPAQMDQYVLTTYTDVYRCKTYSRVNAASDTVAAAAANGYVTIYASKVGGASLTSTAASAIAEDVRNRSVAGLSISVKAPLIVPVTLSATVTLKSGYAQGTVISNVQNALYQYLHPDYWDWSTSVYYNEIISVIDSAEGVGRVASLTVTISGTYATAVGSNYNFLRYGSLPSVVPTISVSV